MGKYFKDCFDEMASSAQVISFRVILYSTVRTVGVKHFFFTLWSLWILLDS
jgi:hypothetical protein